MIELGGHGVQELSWSNGGMGALRESLRFAEQNVHNLRADESLGTRWWRRGVIRAYTVEEFTLVHGEATDPASRDWCGREIRDLELIASDKRDRFALMVQTSGDRRVTQLGRSQLVEAGSAAFFCTSEPYEMESRTLAERSEMIAIYMPGAYVRQRVVNPERLCVRPRASALDALTLEMIRMFAAEAWKFNKPDFHRTARIVSDLVLAAQDGSVDAISASPTGHAVMIARVKAIVRRRMADIELNLSDIAEEAGVSLNYLHKLFRGEGTTLSQFIRSERLRAARKMLELARSRGMTITDVSLSCGFADSSHFSRCFKEAFSLTPREVMRNC